MPYQYRFVSGFLFVASLIGMGFALYLEHVQGLNPCPLCVFQRVGLIILGLFSLLGMLHQPKSVVMKRTYTALGLLGVLWSTAVAARHVWLQNLPPDQVPSCGPGLDYLIDALPLKSVLQQVLSGSGECAVIDWTFLGQSLPVWSLIFFVVLSLVSFWQLLRRYPD